MSTLDDAFPKSPSQVREEKMIALLEQLNKNLAIVGQALLKMHQPMTLEVKSKGKKNVKNI